MEFSGPWIPIYAGYPVPHFSEFEQIVAAELAPSECEDKEWAQRTIVLLLDQQDALGAFEPVWESVLALWRLKYIQPSLGVSGKRYEDVWHLHTMAWLVRCASCYLKLGQADESSGPPPHCLPTLQHNSD
jgi:hypothetical protein